MYLGIEIGGTKIQLGVSRGDGPPLVAMERLAAEPQRGAEEILKQIDQAARKLLDRNSITAIGIGFGGPVDVARGRTVTSYQVAGWDQFPLVDWCRQRFGLPVVLSNDSDAAGLAEARFGGGRGRRIVFYTNVGSGIGGALVIDGRVYGGSGGVASEIGHLRPGISEGRPDQTVESQASGWAITQFVRLRLSAGTEGGDRDRTDLLRRCQQSLDELDTRMVADAALAGNQIARLAFDRAARTYGWAVAQMITLLAPEIVVIGGGVSLVPEDLFLQPVRQYVHQYIFPPLRETFEIVPAILGEQVVVHGALALAADG